MSDRGGRGGRGAPRGQGRGGGGDPGGGGGGGGGRGGQRGDRGGQRGAPRGGGQRFGKLGDDEYTDGPEIYTPPGGETTPSKKVHDKEDAVVASNKELSLDTLSLGDSPPLPLRPGYGTHGRVIHLRTNYFAMEIDPNKLIYKYTVAIKAERKKRNEDGMEQEEPKEGRKQRQAFAILFEEPEFRNLHPGLATDYANTILTSTPLKLGPTKSKVFSFVYRDVEDRVASPNATRYSFTITEAGTVPTQELLRYLASTTTDPSDFAGKADAVQALNIIVARTPNFEPQVFQSGQNKFYRYPTAQQHFLDLTGGLIAVRGYYSSVRTATARILLNVNAQTSPFYPAWNMVQLIRSFGGETATWETEKFIQKLRVKTQYLRDKKMQVEVKVKTVQGFSHKRGERRDEKTGKMKKFGNAEGDFGNAKQIKFDCPDFPKDSPISVEQYFFKKHGITLQSPEMWVLNCGTADRPVWIPPELCTVMPGQPYRGKLSERQTTNILNVAARPPAENARRIAGDGQQVIGIRGNGTAALSAFGLKVDTNMLVVLGRVLPTPLLNYKGSSVQTEQAAWNMRNKQFSVPKPIIRWSFLRLIPAAEFGRAGIDMFKQALRAAGLGQADPVSPAGQQGFSAELERGKEDANDGKIKAVLDKISKLNIPFLLVILPAKGPITYNRVKYWADVHFGIHTVCAVSDKVQENIGPRGMQYFANLTLKFNLKNGGANQLLPQNKLGFLRDGDTMIVGIDVTHPAPGSMVGTPSIAAVVSSVNSQYAQWPGSIRCQESKKEMVSALQDMMEERLEYWIKQNRNMCPRKILIYRDGVSEGQYEKVLKEEFSQILEACKVICQKYKAARPKINIIVVGKRHHTRFYPTEKNYADMTSRVKGNPPNGTVVDRGVTMEKGHDFFLQAHVALQGTAKPAHYVVLLDEMKLGADELQEITHNLCYLWGRATRAVSICPPAYYADILCERGRCYLHKYVAGFHPRGEVFDPNLSPWAQGVHQRLENTMFYV